MQTVNLLVVQPEGLDNERPFSGLVPSMLTPEVRKYLASNRWTFFFFHLFLLVEG